MTAKEKLPVKKRAARKLASPTTRALVDKALSAVSSAGSVGWVVLVALAALAVASFAIYAVLAVATFRG